MNILEMVNHSAPNIGPSDIIGVIKQLKSLQLAHGSLTLFFEERLKNFLNVNYLTSTCNGTHALYLALKALELKKRSEVIVPAYVCKNVYDAVVHAGLTPLLCDIGNSWSVETSNIEEVISSKTKCIIIVHPMGISVDVRKFKKFGLKIIEDCCQNFGGVIGNKQIELIGDIGIYSFHATKCITTGEGGALATNNEFLQKKIIQLVLNKAYKNPLSDLQSALGIAQLEKYPKLLLLRKKIADQYFANINSDLTCKFFIIRENSIFFRFVLWKENIDFEKKRIEFERNGIAIRKGIDELLFDWKDSLKRKYVHSKLTIRSTISIPVHPNLTNEELAHIIITVNTLL
jgi:perosamine synthetase